MTTEEIQRKIAHSEFVHDQLVTELEALDRLLRATGFPDGVASVRQVAEEMLQEGILDSEEIE